MKIGKTLEESGLLIIGISETIKNEAKEQKGGFLGILSGTLGASLITNLLTEKRKIRAGEGTIGAYPNFLMSPHPLISFEIRKYYQNDPEFNGIYSKNNLPRIKGGAYVINLDEFKSIGTRWKALYMYGKNKSDLRNTRIRFDNK